MLPSERALVERALAARSSDEVFATIAPLRGRVTEDRDVAETWLSLLEASPARPGLVEDVRAALWAFPDDDALVVLGLRALLRADERRGLDEPPQVGAPARIALEIAERAVERAGSAASAPLLAMLGNAHRRLGRSHDARAIEALERAVRLKPSDGHAFFDLGLCHKWAGRFRAAALAFERAEERLGPTRAVLFNRATVATASGDPDAAAAAWTRLGLSVERAEGALPLVMRADGSRPEDVLVRVPTRGTGHAEIADLPEEGVVFELLTVAALSPCHGVVRTPTARHAIVDFGDVVLFDPAPVTVTRTPEGARRSIFAILSVIARGDEQRFAFVALEQEAGAVRALGEALPEGCVWYLHDTRVDRVCPRCAAGDTLLAHEHEPPTDRRVVRGKLVVPASVALSDVRRAIERGKGSDVLLALPGLFEALGDTPTAGKHHKTWGVIERGLLAPSTRTVSTA